MIRIFIVHNHLKGITVLYLCMVFFYLSATSQTIVTIIDNYTRLPISNAIIYADSFEIAKSDRNGHFELPGIINQPIVIKHSSYKQLIIQIESFKHQIVLLEPNDYFIAEVIVKAPSSNQRLLKIPGSYSILQKENLNTGQPIVVNDYMNEIAGVYMQTGTLNTSRLTIRGIGSRTPYSTNRIRAYLNEIPITDGNGTSTIENIELSTIGRIEIIKGPSSALYGSGLGGVARLVTNYPQTDKWQATSNINTGSFGHYSYGLSSTINAPNQLLTISYQNTNQEGYRQNNHYKRNTLFYNHHFIFNRHQLEFTAYYNDLNAGIPSSLDKETYLNNPEKAATNWFDIKGFEAHNKWLFGISSNYSISESLQNKATLFSTISDGYEKRPFNNIEDNSKSIGFRDKLTWNKHIYSSALGFEVYNESYNWTTMEPENSDENGIINKMKESRIYSNIFGWFEMKPTPRMVATIGTNYHLLTYKITDKTNNNIDTKSQYSYKPILSPRIGINYELTKSCNLYTSTGHGFSAPSTEETLMPDGDINPNIKPEQGWNIEIGMRGTAIRNKLFYDISLYQIFIKDLLVTKRLNEDQFYGINAGKTNHRGAEINTFLNIIESNKNSLKLSSTATIMQNKFKSFIDDGNDYSENNLPGLPTVKVNVSISAKSKWGLFSHLNFQQVGSQYLNDANEGKNDSWNRLDFKTGWQKMFLKKLKVVFDFSIENLYNTHYAPMIVVNAQGFGGNAARYYYPGLPRNFHTGIRLTYKH